MAKGFRPPIFSVPCPECEGEQWEVTGGHWRKCPFCKGVGHLSLTPTDLRWLLGVAPTDDPTMPPGVRALLNEEGE